jgi:hypothetical protein
MEVNDNIRDAAPADPTDRKTRVRSEIEFPYADLENAVELAQTLYSKAATSSEIEELAAWMNQSATGGTFRTRVSAARIFGLIETAQGRATLTQLGRDILDETGSERGARIEAFLSAELFQAMYEQNKGNLLPPPAAIERQIEGLGVSPKQKERARQTFMKSAIYAGFIDQTSGRFIKPGNAPGKEDTKGHEEGDRGKKGGGSGGGEGDTPAIDPIINGLLARLPKTGEVWPEAQRELWLDLLKGSFKLIYKDSADGLPPLTSPARDG